MSDAALILETAIDCLNREFPPGPTWPPSLVDRVNARLRERGVSVDTERLIALMEPEPRVLVEYRDGGAVPWVRLRRSVTDEDARARLVELLVEARTLDDLANGIAGEYGANPHATYGYAMRFLSEGKANGLDDGLIETFVRALERFGANPRALELTAILRAHAAVTR